MDHCWAKNETRDQTDDIILDDTITIWVQHVGITSLGNERADIAFHPPNLGLIHSTSFLKALTEYAMHYMGDPIHILALDPGMDGEFNSTEDVYQLNLERKTPLNVSSNPELQRQVPTWWFHFGHQTKIYRANIKSAQREANELFKDVMDFGTSLETDDRFVSKYAEAAGIRANLVAKQINSTKNYFADRMRSHYVHSVKLLTDYENNINDTHTLKQALLNNRTIFKADVSFNNVSFASPDLDNSCLNDIHFENSLNCHLKPDGLQHGTLTTARRLSKRQLGVVVAGIGGLITGALGAWSSDGTYTRKQLAVLTQGQKVQGEEILSLENLVRTNFKVSKENFLQIGISLSNIYDLVMASRHLITVTLQSEFLNGFLIHVGQITREITRALALIKDMFVHGLINRFPAHLISAEEGNEILGTVKQLAAEKGLSLYVDSQDALFSADCHVASQTDLFFLLCAIPLKTSVTLKVRYIPLQTFVMGRLKVKLDLDEKYIIHDQSRYRTLSELEFFKHCKTRAAGSDDFVICARQMDSIFIKENPQDSQNCQFRLANGIFQDIAQFCPLVVMPPSDEVVQRVGLTRYRITPLQGLIIVKKICSNRLTPEQQFVIETSTTFDVEAGCQLHSPNHVIGADDIIAGVVTEFSIQGDFQSLVNTTLESLHALEAITDSEELYRLLEHQNLLPHLNTSVPLKELNRLIAETTLAHKATTIGHLLLPPLSLNSILLVLFLLAAVVAILVRRRLRKRRAQPDPENVEEERPIMRSARSSAGARRRASTTGNTRGASVRTALVRPRPNSPETLPNEPIHQD